MVLLTMMITSTKLQATHSITNSRQDAMSDEGRDDKYDDYDDIDLSQKNSFKNGPREFDGFHDVMMEEEGEIMDDDLGTERPDYDDLQTPEPEEHIAGVNEIIKESADVKMVKNGIMNEVEAQFIIRYDLRPLDIGHEKSKKLIASDEMIRRISVIQEKLVETRIKMLLNLLRRAFKATTEIEYKFPNKHSCSVQLYNELIRQDWPLKYPYGLLNMVRAVKEALLKSRADETPIALVDEDVYKRLEFALNRLGDRLRDHGKLVYRILEDLVIEEKRIVRKFCNISRRPNHLTFQFIDN